MNGAVRNPSDRGSVTAEFAVVLPAVMVMAMLLLALTRTIAVSLDCQEAARTVARQLVTGGGTDRDWQDLVQAAADGSTLTIDDLGDRYEVRTRCPVLPGPLDVLPAAVEGFAIGFRQ